jgi:hypothetical protein
VEPEGAAKVSWENTSEMRKRDETRNTDVRIKEK